MVSALNTPLWRSVSLSAISKEKKETTEQQIFSDLNTPLWRSVSLSAISKKRSEKKEKNIQ